jgi:hypothetical protein
MSTTQAREEYVKAQKMGLKELKECTAAGKPTNPAVLDDILPSAADDIYKEVGLVEIPVSRVVGTKSAGRITAISATFLPLLGEDSEFGIKWRNLCDAHMSDEGIREPILCYEYLGDFYIQEGNKRLSVMRYFGAARIPGYVRRIMPQPSEEPRVKAYYEFLEFYKDSGIYEVQYRTPGDYAKLLRRTGKKPGEKWSEWERRNFTAYFQYFCEAFASLGGKNLSQSPEEALLVWLKVYSYPELLKLSADALKKSLGAIWEDLVAMAQPEPVKVETEAPKAKGSLLGRIIAPGPEHLRVALIHQLDPERSIWSKSHDEGRQYLEQAAQGDLQARNILIERNLRLVAHIMKKYYAQTADQEDLISIGTIGLIKGITTFDTSKGARLATYAARCVENEILMHFRAQRKSSHDVSLSDYIETGTDGAAL